LFFAGPPHVLIMFWHDFGQGGGEHHGHHVCARSVVGSSSISLSYFC
jgi:hypothetical protein